MERCPTIEVTEGAEDFDDRIERLRSVFAASYQHVKECREPLHEVCYWPGSIAKMVDNIENVTIYWDDAVCICCFRWAFDRAWNELGDDTPVKHISIDCLSDDEFYALGGVG